MSIIHIFAAAAAVGAAPASGFDGAFVGLEAGWLGGGGEGAGDAAVYGAFAGYDVAISPSVILGVEARLGDSSLSVAEETVTGGLRVRNTLEGGIEYGVAGRVGVAVDPTTLVFARVGWERTELELTQSRTPVGGGATLTTPIRLDSDATAYGLGLETALGGVALRASYDYLDADAFEDGRHRLTAAALFRF